MLTTTPIRNRLISVKVSTLPTDALITIADAKKYLNVTGSDDDALITRLADAAMMTVERLTRRSLLDQQVTTIWSAQALPLRLFRPPVQNIVSVKSIYQGTKSTAETLTNFYLSGADGMRPKIAFKDTFEFTESNIEEIEIVVACGYGDDPCYVPDELVQAAYLILNQSYDCRDNYVEGSGTPVPFDAHRLMTPFIVPVI